MVECGIGGDAAYAGTYFTTTDSIKTSWRTDETEKINPKSVIRAQSSKLFVLVLFPNDRVGLNDFVECINMTNNKTTTPPAAFRRHYMRYSPPYICPLAVDALLDNLSLSC